MKPFHCLLFTLIFAASMISCSDDSNDPVRADTPNEPVLEVEVDELDFGKEQNTLVSVLVTRVGVIWNGK